MSFRSTVVSSLRVKKGRKMLEVGFEGGEKYTYPAEYLRVHTRSADAVGHSDEQRQLVFGKKNVSISNMWQVGNYAVTIEFSDGHKSGIYGWDQLHDLGANKYKTMRQYILDLRRGGKLRVPKTTSTPYPSIADKVAEKLRSKVTPRS